MTPVFWFTVVVQLITSAIVVGIAVQTQRQHTKNIEELQRTKVEADVYERDRAHSIEERTQLRDDVARIRHDIRDYKLATDLRFKELEQRRRA